MSKYTIRLYTLLQNRKRRFVLGLSQDRDFPLRFPTEIYPEESPPLNYAPLGHETHRSIYNALHFLKNADPRLRKFIISNCNNELHKSICECALNILRCNIQLSARSKWELTKYRNNLRRVAEKSKSLSANRKDIVQKG